MHTYTRTYPDGTRATYRLAPGSDASVELIFLPKTRKPGRKADKRLFPKYAPGIDSTADYVRRYFALNTESRGGKPCAYGHHLDHMSLYAPLPTYPATVYTGVDSVETIEEN